MQTTQQTSTKQEILEFLAIQGKASALELAEALDISPQAVRRHLKDLETEELIVNSATEQVGIGRPQLIYKLSQQGRDRLQPIHSYGNFAVSLLDTLAETVGREQVSTILRKQWERKALEYQQTLGNASLLERVAMLVKLRKAEGYMAEFHPVESKESSECENSFIIAEHNCAISNVVESFPSVCGHELEMFATALPDCTVERTHWIIDGEHRCGYLVQPRKG
ncbi:iron-sulfur cluster biosynthesis transcriptional regulator SufR [Brunnivagina elsteri]|uniref:Iron-sulfur cluster biosynthesis transcriptional regulator SufR n=1 Tax=Brunnivagina elsteri CCALA 953 TaxID=987040 RepID=A0A2A2TCZ4_9CYAN|nr:iron-sulfur cluster biosynthesis transcriptional regulator SufR [Calothrix elsteri]PAX51289.1 iron-sulfur cluster biosynthesis transcriptional regulator SufR [Calothrix elsteri CCALA 953]